MNNALLNLKLKTLLSKHTYYSNEIEYKYEIVHEAEPQFINEVKNHIKDNKELIDKFNNIFNPKKINNDFKQDFSNESTSGNTQDINNKSKTSPSKFEQTVFREISKKMHPDKLKNPTAQQLELYSEASDAYTSHDIIKLYRTAMDLNIEVTVDENLITQIEQQIKKMEEKSEFYEKNLAYQWLIAVTDEQRQKVIDFYVKNMLK